ncbi:MAG: Fic family protein [Pelagibacterales bacterium]|nr:Fic family protein [Pelagibacterales bacterium]
MTYQPPFLITNSILKLIAEISEMVGRWSAENKENLSPQLRKQNRIRTIHASLAIENNSLSEKQVSAVIEGKNVLGTVREIKEVQNAILAYDEMHNWQPSSLNDLLKAHEILMRSLVEEAGQFRNNAVGIYKDKSLIHMAPPADRIPHLMQDLFDWLQKTESHPLIASCVFHYEFEFIHPFSDGNGRMGRLWQSLILSKWQPLFAYLAVETVVHKRQEHYYQALGVCDKAGESTLFIEFMLGAIKEAMEEVV